MKKVVAILMMLIFICFRIYAHGEQILVIAVPMIIYILILPYFIGLHDYSRIKRNCNGIEYTKQGFVIINYATVLFAYFILVGIESMNISLTDNQSIFIFTIFLMIIQTIGKSSLYFIFKRGKFLGYKKILNSIYLTNIIIICGIVLLGYFIKMIV